MSAEKRPALDSFRSTQLVKRPRSDSNLGDGRAVAVVNNSAQNGALIQAVRPKKLFFSSFSILITQGKNTKEREENDILVLGIGCELMG